MLFLLNPSPKARETWQVLAKRGIVILEGENLMKGNNLPGIMAVSSYNASESQPQLINLIVSQASLTCYTEGCLPSAGRHDGLWVEMKCGLDAPV